MSFPFPFTLVSRGGSIHLDVTKEIHTRALQRRVVVASAAGGAFTLIDARATYAGWLAGITLTLFLLLSLSLLSFFLSSVHVKRKKGDTHKNKRHIRALWGSRTKRRDKREKEKKERDR